MLFLRGLWWRRGFSLAVLLVGVVSAAVAAIGPLYARASSESTLTDALRDHAPGSGLAFSFASTADTRPGEVAAMLGRDTRPRHYGTPIRGASSTITAKGAQNSASSSSTLVWRDGQCSHVVLTAGRCPQHRGEIMVPLSATTSDPAWRLGQSLVVRQGIYLMKEGVTKDGQLLGRMRVVGVYRARDTTEPYWFGQPFFGSTLGPAVTSAIKGGADAIFVTQDQYTALPAFLASTTEFDLPLRAESVRLDDVSALRREVAAIQRRFPRQASATRPSMRTDLSQALADAARDRRQVNTATLVVVLELAALSLLVLFHVVGGAVAARGDEIALAKLRGLRPRRTIGFAFGEPLALLLLAAPIGFGVGLGVTTLLAGSALVGGTPVAATAAVGWALLAAFAGSALAGVLAAVRTVTRPVLEQWRNTTAAAPSGRRARWLLGLDLVVAALAVATVVVLQVGNHARPRAVFLLAPVLIVFAVALMGMRLLPRAGRRGLGRTRASRHVASFLALRQTVRRPGGLRLATLLVVAAGLATFAVCGEAVARGNRIARAHTELGAAQRIAVQYEVGHDPEAIVRAADRQHRWAMAAASYLSDGGPSNGTGFGSTVNGSVLGVEPEALAAAGYHVRGQLSPAQLARDITATTAAPVNFRGTRLVADIRTTALQGDRSSVVFEVRTPGGQTVQANATPLRPGTGQYTAVVGCAGGCTFAGLSFTRSIDAQDAVTGSAVITSVRVQQGGESPRALPLRLQPGAWRSDKIGVDASTRFSRAPGGLGVRFRSTGGASPVFDYADSPARLPMVAAPDATSSDARTGQISDYSGASPGYVVVRRASPLPVVLDTGAVTNLHYLRSRLPDFDNESSWTVWLGPHAPADAVARLARGGLLVEHVDTAAARVAALGRQGPALGLLLLLVCAIAAAVLAVGGTAVSVLAEARRRSFELAALRVVGVSLRTLRRSAVAEQVLLLGSALVLALPAGYAAAALVLPVVPEFSDPTPVVLRFTPPVLVALACAAGFGLLLLVTALVAGRALTRAAVPARLRETAQ